MGESETAMKNNMLLGLIMKKVEDISHQNASLVKADKCRKARNRLGVGGSFIHRPSMPDNT